MKRVLLTGATGFVGRNVVASLAALGFEVHAAVWGPTPAWTTAVREHACDLLADGTARAVVQRVRPTHLLHLAWDVTPGRYWTSPENLRWVRASLELVQAFAEAGGERAVLAGTCAEYDWSVGHCHEDATPSRPSSLYGTCKNSLREMFLAYARQSGFSAGWGRLFFLYGPGEPSGRLVPSVLEGLLAGRPVPCTHGRQVRDFLHVQDAAQAFACLLDGRVEGTVNIASGQPVELRELVATLEELTGRPGLARFGELPVRAGEPETLTADVTRLAVEVGWTPKYGLREGLARTVDWWRAHPGGVCPDFRRAGE